MTDRLGAFADPPERERPTTPGHDYGVPRRGGEFIEWAYVVDRLTDGRNYWVATATLEAKPHAAPIWGVFVGNDLFLETAPHTKKGRILERNPAVVVHLEDGDGAVIVEGTARDYRPDADLASAIATAFAKKYAGYAPQPDQWSGGSLYRVVPDVVLAWREMPTATRWRFRRNG
jgi:nitroimidazol reductase NimA-like FMN-containing flavoprotein (pyridoxamine 5'-phosphate oxidase superfamily)